jgi:predicted amidohydrolase
MVQFTAACIQLNSQDDLGANMRALESLVRKAAKKGAVFIALPENALFMQEPGKGAPPRGDAAIRHCGKLARELKVWLLMGSVQVPSGTGKSLNRSLLIDDTGKIAARYDKIHLFDVTLKKGETYSESARIEGGAEAVIAHTPWGRLGMTVCYDLRFPHLYRTLAQAGAEFLSVPSAFTYTTGTAHWHTLLRARAIENGCYVFAPAQCGQHPAKRRTYGHSLIVSPWGEILAEGSEDKTGIITAKIDTDKIREARAMIPSLRHDRAFGLQTY